MSACLSEGHAIAIWSVPNYGRVNSELSPSIVKFLGVKAGMKR